MYVEKGIKYYRNICTRNCYDTCSMVTAVQNGRIVKVTGDEANSCTGGKLCAKGMRWSENVYSRDRILYPLRQKKRGLGEWERISWDEAVTVIAEKILSLKKKYGSTLPLCLNKYSGNFGIMHYAVEGMFNSLGPTTQTIGTPCLSSGLDGQRLDFGGNITSDLNDLENSKLIILWGVNPAWTAIHAMPYLYRAQAKGAKIIVIDPIFTETAKKADVYIQVKMGEDASLVLALLKVLQEQGRFTDIFCLKSKTTGAEAFCRDLSLLDLKILLERCGQSRSTVEKLADWISENSPMHIWCGFGLQRHMRGGMTIQLIDALSMLTGNIGIPGGGVNYAQMERLNFSKKIMQPRTDNRCISINRFSHALRQLNDPPVKLLWIACRNVLMQDVRQGELQDAWENIDLVVSAEKFMTATAKMSDIVLPVTTEFEELDAFYGYFNHWIGLNEPAIKPLGEAKSDVDIARLLSRKLNELSPNTSSFPVDKSDEELLDEEFTHDVYTQLGISDWRELRKGPRKINQSMTAWQGDKFETDDGKFHFCQLNKNIFGLASSRKYPYHLITPHSHHSINSQYVSDRKQNLPVVWLSENQADKKGLKNGDRVRLFNAVGEVTVLVATGENISEDLIICYQGENKSLVSLNKLNIGLSTDLGEYSTGVPGVATYDVLVNIEPLKPAAEK